MNAAPRTEVPAAAHDLPPVPEQLAAIDLGSNSFHLVIGKVVDGEAKEVHFIRADTSTSREAAISLSVSKARKIIEEQGERIFRGARA